MSVAGILDAMRSDLPPACRLVWQCLENHANGQRWWRMTHEQIAVELSLGLNTVVRAVAKLEYDKIIRVERHRRRFSDFYMLRIYPEKGSNGHTPEPDLTTQIGVPSGDLTTQIGVSTNGVQVDLTPQNGLSNGELTPQIGCSSVELNTQNGLPLSTSKSPPVSAHQHPPRVPARGRVCARGDDFDTFWKRFPRKKNKGRARTAWQRAVRKASAGTILAAVDAAVWADDPRYIPHPATWLNGEGWLDEEDAFDPVLRAVGLTPEDFLTDGGMLQ